MDVVKRGVGDATINRRWISNMVDYLVGVLSYRRLRQANMKVLGQRVLENFAKFPLIESIFNDGTKAFRIVQETHSQRQVLFIFGYPLPQNYFGEKVPI